MKPILITILIASTLVACGRAKKPDRVPGTLFDNYFNAANAEEDTETFIDFYDDETKDEDD